MVLSWWCEEYNPEDVKNPVAPTRQVERKRRKSRFEVLVQFLVPSGLLGFLFWNMYAGLPLHTWLIMLGSVFLYLMIGFAIYPVEYPDRHNLPNTLLKHPYRLAKTEHGIQRILTLLLTPGWLMAKTWVRFYTLLRYATVRGKQADQLYYSTNLFVDKWWVLPGLALIGLSYTPIGELSAPWFENDLGFFLAYGAGFLMIFGVRARNMFMEVCHKIIATIWAALPTIFVAFMLIGVMMGPLLFSFLLSFLPEHVVDGTQFHFFPVNQSVATTLYQIGEMILILTFIGSLIFVVWSLTRHMVYEKYSRDVGEHDGHYVTLVLLYLFGGTLGLHRFYTDRVFTGLLYMCTLGLFGIGLIYDGFLLLFGGFDTT